MTDNTHKSNHELALEESMAKAGLFDKKTESQAPEDGPLFQDIDGDQEVTEIESLCMNCHENGTTKLLLTRIPHYREVIVMAFECPHCNYRSNELQQAAAVAVGGSIYICKVSSKADLNRQLVKSDSAVVKIPEADFEIPAQRGHLTTIEGLLQTVTEDLSSDQAVRKHLDENLYNQIEAVIQKLQDLRDLKQPFTVILDDPAGNSYIESLEAPKLDDKLELQVYMRTRAQNIGLGLSVPEEEAEEEEEKSGDAAHHQPQQEEAPLTENEVQDQMHEHAQRQLWEAGLTEADLERERKERQERGEPVEDEPLPDVLSFPANCSSCGAHSDTKMHMINIPHFKEVIIMSTACDECGYKSNEVKAGGPVSAHGKKITLKMEDLEDMSRDILKSETCGLEIPEIDLELNAGTLGGRFTTVEGLLRQVHDELSSKVPHESEDQPERRAIFTKFLDNLEKVMSLEIKATLILDDPLGNSYLQNLYAPEPDPQLTIEEYERTFEQNEGLGLNDIRLENYENDHDDHDEKTKAHEEKEEEHTKELTDEQRETEEKSGTGVSGGH
ncbi:nucleolar zinc-finger protein [Actinomortierella ambigua]|uniref:Nucleolar zinc-finger protein n=1 Tax=Actinomortierella ambigua TaxID=1343610 RepID=A0A9P6TY03_9FUNG|nr:nucleolar zinc-finger protein [Actinomortierella ambigua]